MTVTRLNCCGIIEINGIAIKGDDHKGLLLQALDVSLYTSILKKCGWVIFSQAWNSVLKRTYGTKFKEFLESNGLGTVVQLESTLNLNSMNMIDVFCWRVDHDALQKWYDENKPAPVQQISGPTHPAFSLQGAGLTTAQVFAGGANAANPQPTVTGNL